MVLEKRASSDLWLKCNIYTREQSLLAVLDFDLNTAAQRFFELF